MSDLDLDPKYESGRSYLVGGALLNAIIRFLRLNNIVAGDGLTETAGPNGRVLRARGGGGAATRGDLVAYILDGEVAVSPGLVGGIMPTMGGSPLDADPIPTLPLAEGNNYLHLRGTYDPSVYELAPGFAAIGAGGSVSAPVFSITSTAAPSPSEVYPVISGSSATAGTFDIVWARIEVDGDDIQIADPSGSGDANIVFMPPDLFVAFRNVNISGS